MPIINININGHGVQQSTQSIDQADASPYQDYPLLPGFSRVRERDGFRKIKTKKKKNCNNGQVCGFSCVSKSKTCTANMTAAQFKAHNEAKRQARRKKVAAKKAAAGGAVIVPSSEVKTYQEAIERGKAIAAKFEKPITDADIKRIDDIKTEMDANWKEYSRLGGILYSDGEALPADQSQLLKDQRDAIAQKNKQLNEEAVSISKRQFEPVDYDGLTQQMKSMSGVDAATAKSIVEGMDFDQSLNKPRQVNGKKYNHSVDELKQSTAEYLMLTGDKTRVQKVFQDITKDGKRAYADQIDRVTQAGMLVREQPKKIVNIGTPAKNNAEIKETLFHELTHHVEFETPRKAVIAFDWVFDKATGPLEKLSKITGNKNYGKDEVAYPDKFITPYVGKKYGQEPITEVLTVGFQHFASPIRLNELYNKDKEHFYLTLGLIAG